MKIPVIQFTDGGTRVSYQPPGNWQVSGGGAELSLYPPDRPEAVMKLQVKPRKLNLSGIAESPDDLKKWAEQFLPKDATEPSLLATNQSPFTLHATASLEFVFTYLQGGRRFNKSVAIVDLDPQQRLALTVAARAGDFEAVRSEAIGSMFTWQ
jgi:hypothetical protein